MREAYADRALAIECRQTISQPYMVAVMTEAVIRRLAGPEGPTLRTSGGPVGPDRRTRVLEIGTGSGYQAAVLSALVDDVISIERHEALAAQARARLARLGYANVQVLVGDGTRGWPALAPYHGIVVTAGAPVVPAALTAQLADGASLVIPVGSEYLQQLMVLTRHGDRLEQHVGESCAFVPLIGEQGWSDRS
jgi:protein-L-isoaspartate(D-aspartate) O-methyltransferase